MWFDSDFSLSKHIQNIYTRAVFSSLEISDESEAILLLMLLFLWPMLISSRLDYCNSLFRSLSRYNLRKLQCIENCVAQIVSYTNRYSRITLVLEALQSHGVEQRSNFKTMTLVNKFLETMTLVNKFLHTGVPKYFEPYISPQQSIYNTRLSQSQGSFLIVPKFHSSSHKTIWA